MFNKLKGRKKEGMRKQEGGRRKEGGGRRKEEEPKDEGSGFRENNSSEGPGALKFKFPLNLEQEVFRR